MKSMPCFDLFDRLFLSSNSNFIWYKNYTIIGAISSKALGSLKGAKEDQNNGITIALRAMEAPLREIVTNCGEAPMVTPNHAATQAVALLRAGDATAAQAQARRATAMTESRSAVATAGSRSSAYALACYHTLRGDRDEAIRVLQRFPGRGWVEPALDRDPNLASLRSDPRFLRIASWMRAQPIDRIFSQWGKSP